MTRRQRLEMVVAGIITEELIADCQRELEKLDAQRAEAKAKNEGTAHYNENKALETAILEVLSEEPCQIDELANRIGSTVARQRLTAICTNLIREERIKSVDVKTPKGKRKAYYI